MSEFIKMTIRDSKEAFQNAINKGLKNPEDYMYMYSEKNRDYFKHIDTRQYIAFKYRSITPWK